MAPSGSNDDDLPPGVKIIKASKELQLKAGTGEINPELVRLADQYLQDNNEDYTPLALEALARIAHLHEQMKKDIPTAKNYLPELVAAIMQLKANGKMFRYDLISMLAGHVLDCFENIEDVDADMLDLNSVHLASQQLILARKIRGDGGALGIQLNLELKEACQRYYKKHPPVSRQVPS